MIKQPRITIPPDVAVSDPIRAQTTNDMLHVMRQSQSATRESRRGHKVFDLYAFTSFRVTLETTSTCSVSAGRIFVHAVSGSPYAMATTTGLDLSIAASWWPNVFVFAWLTWPSTVGVAVAQVGTAPSTATILRVPLAGFTRFGTSVADYGYTLNQILHIGDVHICSAFAATI